MRDEPTPPPKRSVEVETDYLTKAIKMEGEDKGMASNAMVEEEDTDKTPMKRAPTPMPTPMGLPGVFTSSLTPPRIPAVLPPGCKTSETHPLKYVHQPRLP